MIRSPWFLAVLLFSLAPALIGQATPPAQPPSSGQINGEARHKELLRNRKAFYGDRFKEYKAGRLSDEEVYIDLMQLVSTLANLWEKDTPEFAEANAELDRLKRKHPEFRDKVREMFEAQQARVRKTRPDIAMRGGAPPARPPERSAESFRPKLGPRDKSYIEHKRKQIAEFGKMLEEFHDGRRSDGDGYAIIDRLIWAHGAIGVPDPAAVEKLQTEFKEILARHPEFRTNRPRLSDDVKREEDWKRQAAEREEKLKTWEPADSVPIKSYFDGKWVLAAYSYRLEFYEADSNLMIPLEYGHSVITNRLPEQLSQHLSEGKARLRETIAFEHVIAHKPTFPLPENRFILACADRFAHYKPGPNAEGELIGGSRHWSNPNADIKGEKCLVLSIDGKTRFEFSIHSDPPQSYVMPLGVAPDGSSALLGEGEAVMYEEKAGGWGMDRCLNYVLWTRNEGVKRIPVVDVNADQEAAFQREMQARPCPR